MQSIVSTRSRQRILESDHGSQYLSSKKTIQLNNYTLNGSQAYTLPRICGLLLFFNDY